MSPRVGRRVAAKGSGRRPGPAEPLSRERIVSVALAIVDEGGLTALSMRSLAAALGVDPMATYNYLANKRELYDALMEAVIVDIKVPTYEPSMTFCEYFVLVGREFRAATMRHPHTAPLMAVRLLATPEAFRVAEKIISGFVKAGLTCSEGIAAFNIIFFHVTAIVQRQVYGRRRPALEPHGIFRAKFREMRDELNPMEFPVLARALAEDELLDYEEEFECGIQALARGLAGLVKRSESDMEVVPEGSMDGNSG